MTQILFLGDPHGDLHFVEKAAALARQHDAEIVCLGDWGFIWGASSQLAELSDLLVSFGIKMRFIDGNHDTHPRLRSYVGACTATTIALNVIYQPRGSVHEDEDGTRFLFCGGAPSIDRDGRVEGKSWWPEETISEDEYQRALSAAGPIHVLVTHDAPDYPPGFGPKGTPDFIAKAVRSMEMVRSLGDKFQPELNVHGHWHRRSTTRRGVTRIEAIASNLQRFNDAVLLWSRSTHE